MPSNTDRNIATLLADGEGSLRACLQQANMKARNSREDRLVSFQYAENGVIIPGSFTLTHTTSENERSRGHLYIKYDTATYALRIQKISISERGTSVARHELENLVAAYNGLHAPR